jgi:hypothetical protein
VIESLHEKYVPILRLAKGERFYPMAVDDFVGYSRLRKKGVEEPLAEQGKVTVSLLTHTLRQRPDLYLQSVPASLAEQNVAGQWSQDLLRAVVDVSTKASRWKEELAKMAYQWFSAKTAAATKLFWWNGLVMDLVEKEKRSHQDLPRLNLPPEIRQAAVENYERSQPRIPNYTYYYRTTRDGRYLCLQYWLFYAFNDWATGFGGMNDHEGDWEGMSLFFELGPSGQPIEPPAYVTYAGHHSRLTKPWGHPDMTLDGTHPVAYVAAGSHATYPERKEYELMSIYGLTDYATGDGRTIEPGDWRQRIDLGVAPWAADFMGAWGTRYWLPLTWAKGVLGTLKTKAEEIGLPGVSAPRGPRYTDEGGVRPNWSNVVAWAGLLDLEKE